MNTTKQEIKIAAYLVQTSDYCWGKGRTVEEAIKSARGEGSRVTKASKTVDYIVFEFDDNVKYDSIFVDQMGSSRWEVHTPDEAAGFSQGLVREWMRRNGKVEILKGGE